MIYDVVAHYLDMVLECLQPGILRAGRRSDSIDISSDDAPGLFAPEAFVQFVDDLRSPAMQTLCVDWA